MSGKGDRARNCHTDEFRDGWDRIFGRDRKSTASDRQDGGSNPPASTKSSKVK